MKNNNNWIWIVIGIVAFFLIIGKGETLVGTQSLFSTVTTCTSNEPTTLEGYKTIMGNGVINYEDDPQVLRDIILESNGKLVEMRISKTECSNNLQKEFTEQTHFILQKSQVNSFNVNIYTVKRNPTLSSDPSYYNFWCSKDNNFVISVGSVDDLSLDNLNGLYFNKVYTCVSKECNNYYWFDDTNKACGYKEFCGTFMYNGLRTFSTLSTCEEALGIKVCPAVVGYKIEDNKCVYTTNGCEVDYGTLQECQDKLPKVEVNWLQQSIYNGIKVWHLLLGLIAVGGYFIFRKK